MGRQNLLNGFRAQEAIGSLTPNELLIARMMSGGEHPAMIQSAAQSIVFPDTIRRYTTGTTSYPDVWGRQQYTNYRKPLSAVEGWQ